MRNELDDSNKELWNLKHGAGGIGDIEFLVQYLVLQYADEFPAVIEFTDNIRQLNALAECGALSLQDAAKLQSIYRAYRRRQHHLALDGVPARVAADEFSSEREDVERIWHQVFES
jgi:glutamate-ammonia-ligase adenylyltransferase